jgi:methionyl-tRNA formyltransferase
MERQTCYLIGRTGLLQLCGDAILEQQKLVILGVVALDAEAKIWCESRKLKMVVFNDLAQQLQDDPCDFLFSIFNPRILHAKHLNPVRKMALNCHDGPLPRYGGVNACAWALLNLEQEHGVTWHSISMGVDEGDIVEQSVFPICSLDTTRTVRLTAAEEAYKLFVKLLPCLVSGIIQTRPQDHSKRSYFSLQDTPTLACCMDFRNQTALYFDALVRACSFGEGEFNNYGAAKVHVGSGVYVLVTKSTLLSSNSELDLPAGTIHAIDNINRTVTIACSPHLLRLEGVSHLDGSPLAPSVMQSLFKPRSCIPAFSLEPATLNLIRQVSQHESFWSTKLAVCQPISRKMLEFVGLHSVFVVDDLLASQSEKRLTDTVVSVCQPIPADVCVLLEPAAQTWGAEELGIFVAASYFVAQLPVRRFHLAVANQYAQQVNDDGRSLLSAVSPLLVDVCEWNTLPISSVIASIRKQLEDFRKSKSFPWDLLWRSSALRGKISASDVCRVVFNYQDSGQGTPAAVISPDSEPPSVEVTLRRSSSSAWFLTVVADSRSIPTNAIRSIPVFFTSQMKRLCTVLRNLDSTAPSLVPMACCHEVIDSHLCRHLARVLTSLFDLSISLSLAH